MCYIPRLVAGSNKIFCDINMILAGGLNILVVRLTEKSLTLKEISDGHSPCLIIDGIQSKILSGLRY